MLTEAVDPKYPHIVREETVIAREENGSEPKNDAPAKDLKEGEHYERICNPTITSLYYFRDLS